MRYTGDYCCLLYVVLRYMGHPHSHYSLLAPSFVDIYQPERAVRTTCDNERQASRIQLLYLEQILLTIEGWGDREQSNNSGTRLYQSVTCGVSRNFRYCYTAAVISQQCMCHQRVVSVCSTGGILDAMHKENGTHKYNLLQTKWNMLSSVKHTACT